MKCAIRILNAVATIACGVAAMTAHAQPSLWWSHWSPGGVGPGPGFINPPNLIVGGWWNSPAYGRSPITICRLSDGMRWSYGGFRDGSCYYYSPSLNRGHHVSIGFDLMGGLNFPIWISPGSHGPRYTIWSTGGMSGQGQSQANIRQQSDVSQDELSSLCRINQADGSFVGTLMDGTCYAAWHDDQEIISADYEVPETSQD
ncbi:hypothetical protein EBU99_12620 [bacterium]|nr:hypothetical protein [bacterium]